MTPQLEEKFMSDFRGHEAIVYSVGRIYFMNPKDREDVFQEIVYQAWKSYPAFRGESKFSTWLYRVAINTALTFVRKSIRALRTDVLHEGLDAADDDTEEDDKLKNLYAAIYSLSHIDRAIILLHLDEQDYDEIAAVTGLSRNNVSVRLVRIKKKLIELISKKQN